MTLKPDPMAYPPRGFNREEAARYVGVSPTKFDEMVLDKRMPKPREVDRRSVWDRFQLDAAFSICPHATPGSISWSQAVRGCSLPVRK